MFEDDVTVPAGWYPDPMGLPQLRWWNNHAWTELTTEARPPLVVQTATRLAYADDELPTRRQQREQRERDEEYATLATDEGDARDAAAAHSPLNVTLREIDPPASADAELDDDVDDDDETDGDAGSGPTGSDRTEHAHTEDDHTEDDHTEDEDDAVDPGDRASSSHPTPSAHTRPAAGRQTAPLENVDTIDYDSIDYDSVSYDSGSFDSGNVDSVDGSPLAFTARPSAAGVSESFEALFQPRSAEPVRDDPAAQRERATPDSRSDGDREAYSDAFGRRGSASRLPIYTAPVWIIALVPLLLLVFSLLLLLGFGSSLNMWVTPAIWGISYLAVVILAITDRAALGRAGYEHRASWAWALLTAPVYLLARSMSLSKVGPLGFAPVLVWAALGILQIGSVLVVPGLIISALPNVFATQAEQSIASDASIIGVDLAVKCSPSLPVLVGQTFDCAATSGKDHYDLTVVLQRTNGWIDWHVSDWGYLHGAPTT
ncbi:DUF2510 domain-containing protein [Glaciihabitans sp. INWT7]|uniref:DUF2510 domain-containing protein n=1 Tax=Glaciihabitans sp. INWT7 TaxID=2596912 RepID=UPI001628045B|nr:DUF2510 domain-containing protein [Glaciihabitans sp. INWT7]QNE46493.1 DUF2510 domain-containing protein [Glaciihabitans sp. INWT7]